MFRHQNDYNTGEIDTLHKLTSSVVDKSNSTNEEYTVDYALLNDIVLDALTGEVREIINKDDVNSEEINDDSIQPSEVKVEVTIGNRKPTKIKRRWCTNQLTLTSSKKVSKR